MMHTVHVYKFTLGGAPLHPIPGSSGGETSIENEESEIDIIEDASEGEHCYFCDSKFRTGWKSN